MAEYCLVTSSFVFSWYFDISSYGLEGFGTRNQAEARYVSVLHSVPIGSEAHIATSSVGA